MYVRRSACGVTFGSGAMPRSARMLARFTTGARTRSRTLSLSRGRPLAVAKTNSSTLAGLRSARHVFSCMRYAGSWCSASDRASEFQISRSRQEVPSQAGATGAVKTVEMSAKLPPLASRPPSDAGVAGDRAAPTDARTWAGRARPITLVEREQPQTIPVTLAVLVYDVTDGSHVESQALGAIHRWTVPGRFRSDPDRRRPAAHPPTNHSRWWAKPKQRPLGRRTDPDD